MAASTHPVQLAAIGAALALDVLALVYLNVTKRRGASSSLSWPARRNCFWILISALVALAVWLDAHYAITPTALAIKSYAFAFPLGLLDLHFSSTAGVPLKVLAGAEWSAVSADWEPYRCCVDFSTASWRKWQRAAGPSFRG